VTITARDDVSGVTVTVADDGAGIAREQHRADLRPVLHDEEQRHRPGSRDVSRDRLRAWRRIEVESDVGKGTKMVVRLPRPEKAG